LLLPPATEREVPVRRHVSVCLTRVIAEGEKTEATEAERS